MLELQTFLSDSKFAECFKHLVVECKFVENPCFITNSIWYMVCTDSKKARTDFFVQPIAQTTDIECAI